MKEKVIGKYTILEEIGRGGMGVVYKGRHASLNRFAAIKVLPSQLAADELCLQRFLREANTLAKLQHQNIVNIYDVETLNDTQYLIMEYVNGRTLADLLRSNGPFSPDEASKIISSVALALSHAHSKGIIHRDIKPANIMIDEDGVVKVTDFGIARVMANTSVTRTGIIGTPKYMSPERIKDGEDIDGRSDIYSLGIVFYEMVTGRVPFQDENEFTVLKNHVQKPPPPPSRLRSDLPPVYEKIILRCLAKKRTARYPTCNDLVASLNDAFSERAPGGSISDSTKAIERGIQPKIAGVLHSGISILQETSEHRRRLFLLTASALFVIVIAIWLIISNRSHRAIRPDIAESSRVDSASDLTGDFSPLFSPGKGLALRSVKSKNEELLASLKGRTSVITSADIKRCLRIKAGVRNDSGENSAVTSALCALLDRIEQVTRIENGECDVLLTLSNHGQKTELTVKDNVYGDDVIHAHHEVLSVDDQEDLIERLEAIMKRGYCFNALHALSVLNPLHDELWIKVETSGKTDRVFQIGDNINICMTPSRRRYGMLFNINLDGIYLLFPRFDRQQNLLKAGETQCSGSIEVSPPTGNEMIFSIMCSDAQLLPLRDYYFTDSRAFHSWSYDLSDSENAISFCEQLVHNLSNEPVDKWCTKSLFIKTF